ncbi:hypothetical protein BG015_000298 [Linnemannia schmuckeri]|uniref:HCP-like protein n=1 Tax=Linnemannia schmuckeri TaxID=64567 RepID=A0A9P5RR86_9FUNG|nr:hypothetical protein BG015_000298 [Linnemannia schmuckeri]
MMIHDTHTNVQPVRRIYENEDSTNTSTTSAETVYLVCHPDPSLGKAILLWDDILAAFKDDVLHVRSGAVVLPFLKGPDFKNLEPLRIATVPGITLDVVIRRQLIANSDLELDSQATLGDLTRNSSNSRESELFNSTDNSFSCDPPRYSSVITQDWMGTEREARLREMDSMVAQEEMNSMVAQEEMNSMVALGEMYKNGQGVEQDYAVAMAWYLKAARQGDANAQCNVAYLFEDGLGTQKNYTQAKEWYQKAADQGHVVAQCNLGYMYEHGRGVQQDYSQAMKWYLKAADQAHAPAQQNIGNLFHNGRGVSKDFSLAMEWYRKAAAQGKSSAYYHIGLLYERGRGVEMNRAAAMVWYTKAFYGGFTKAKAKMESMDQKAATDKVTKKQDLPTRIFK